MFSHQDLILHTTAFVPGECLPENIDQTITEFIRARQLITITPATSQQQRHFYTTPQALHLETKTIALIKSGQQQVTALAHHIDTALITKASQNLRQHQQQALQQMLSNRDRIFGVQGVPGSGKTHLILSLKTITDQINYTLIGAAPTRAAANVLEQATGIHSYTLPGVLYHLKTTNADLSRTIIILDEATMVSSQYMHDIVHITTKKNTRLFPLGDTAQLPAIEHGRLFSTAQIFGMNTAHMEELLRQQHAPALQQAISYSLLADYQFAFKHLQQMIFSK